MRSKASVSTCLCRVAATAGIALSGEKLCSRRTERTSSSKSAELANGTGAASTSQSSMSSERRTGGGRIRELDNLLDGQATAECVQDTNNHVPGHVRCGETGVVACIHQEALELKRRVLILERRRHGVSCGLTFG